MLLQVKTTENCITLFYLWVGDQAAADNHKKIKKELLWKFHRWLISFLVCFFHVHRVQVIQHLRLVPSSAATPAAFPRAWPCFPFLHPHPATLGYSFSNGRCPSRWWRRWGSRAWTWAGFWESCPQATDWRTLQDRKERVSGAHVTSSPPTCTTFIK